MANMTISHLARVADVGVETVRYYQRRGLLDVPAQSEGYGIRGGIRRYGADDLRRLRFIRAAQASGFTLDQIAELLALDTCGDRRRARTLAAERIAALDDQIARLQSMRSTLGRLEDACRSGAPGPCPILSAFDGDTAATN